MKRLASVLAVAGTVFLCASVSAQTRSFLGPAPTPVWFTNSLFAASPTGERLLTARRQVTLNLSNAAQSNIVVLLRNPQVVAPRGAPLVGGTNSAATAIPPGLYQAEPYSCLVLVPGPHPDDKCIIGNGAGLPVLEMPTVKPELRFMPRKP